MIQFIHIRMDIEILRTILSLWGVVQAGVYGLHGPSPANSGWDSDGGDSDWSGWSE